MLEKQTTNEVERKLKVKYLVQQTKKINRDRIDKPSRIVYVYMLTVSSGFVYSMIVRMEDYNNKNKKIYVKII